MSPAAARKSGIVVPHQASPSHRFAAGAVYILIRLLAATWRFRFIDTQNTRLQSGPVIFCFWHNRLGVAPLIYLKYARRRYPAEGLVGVVSASRDGGLLAALLERFGFVAARGSSSRRGAQAILEATSWIEKRFNAAVTPDGPRGPKYRLQDGVVTLAQVSGVPIVPVSTRVRWKIRLRSWDAFQIPLPFARCEIRVGEAIQVPRELTEEDRAGISARISTALMDLTRD